MNGKITRKAFLQMISLQHDILAEVDSKVQYAVDDAVKSVRELDPQFTFRPIVYSPFDAVHDGVQIISTSVYQSIEQVMNELFNDR